MKNIYSCRKPEQAFSQDCEYWLYWEIIKRFKDATRLCVSYRVSRRVDDRVPRQKWPSWRTRWWEVKRLVTLTLNVRRMLLSSSCSKCAHNNSSQGSLLWVAIIITRVYSFAVAKFFQKYTRFTREVFMLDNNNRFLYILVILFALTQWNITNDLLYCIYKWEFFLNYLKKSSRCKFYLPSTA